MAILGASGAVGRVLTQLALQRGHDVVAISRHPDAVALPDEARLTRAAADVTDTAATARTLAKADARIVFSALGVSSGDRPGVLTAGARAIVAANPERAVSVGAFGTGPSAEVAGWLTRTMLGLFMGKELPDKITADAALLDFGATVVHAGPMTNGPASRSMRVVGVQEVPRRLLPARITHASVATAMLDAAEADSRGRVVIPLTS